MSRVSRLAVGNDDHPEAALKHFDDARVLAQAGRSDGAAYHAGYVVECSVKAVILHDRSFDATTGTTNRAQLAQWHQSLSRRPYGHDLRALLAAIVGAEGARYLPDIEPNASVMQWQETLRYSAPGRIRAAEADAYVLWAEFAVNAIARMRADGVL